MASWRDLRGRDLSAFDWYDREVHTDPVLPGVYRWDLSRIGFDVAPFFRIRQAKRGPATLQDVEAQAAGEKGLGAFVAVGALPGGDMLFCLGGRVHVVPEHFLRGLELTRKPARLSAEVRQLLRALESGGLRRPGSEPERMGACRQLVAEAAEAGIGRPFEFATSAEFIALSPLYDEDDVRWYVGARTVPRLGQLALAAAGPLPPVVRHNGWDVGTARVIADAKGVWGIDRESDVVKFVDWMFNLGKTAAQVSAWLTAPWFSVDEILTIPFGPMDTVEDKARYFALIAEADFGSAPSALQGWARDRGLAFARSGKLDFGGDVLGYSEARFLTTEP
jgi:hypothetical protein